MAENKVLVDLYVKGKLRIEYPTYQSNYNNDIVLIYDPFSKEIKQMPGSELTFQGSQNARYHIKMNQRLIGIIDGVNQAFITPHTGVYLTRQPSGELSFFNVYLNGQRLNENEDFNVTHYTSSSAMVTFLIPPNDDGGIEDILTVDYFTWYD